jgi:hypothetical protein
MGSIPRGCSLFDKSVNEVKRKGDQKENEER